MEPEKIKKALSEMGFDGEGSIIDGAYVINLNGSDGYARAYTLLDKNASFDLGAMSMDVDHSFMTYLGDELDITIEADLDNDKYTLTAKEAEE